MNNTPRKSSPNVAKLEQLRAESEAARLALCKASAACREATRAWPQEAIARLNAAYDAALAVRKAAQERFEAAYDAARNA
jgi:hypothetical protein